MPTVYSHSRLSSFENCKKQFHFRYVLEVPTDTEGIEAFVGKLVHKVLERLYEFVDDGMVPSVEKVVARYHEWWENGDEKKGVKAYDAERVRVVRTGTPVSEYRSLGERCLRNYYRLNYPFDADETLGIEEKVEFKLDDAGEYPMVGFIDRVVRARDGTIEIHDYKTGRWVPSQKNLDKDRQLALYQIALADTYGTDQPMRLVWHYVQHAKVRTSTRTPEELAALRHDTMALIDRIGDETEYKPKKINLCGWCEYKPICPLWTEEDASATTLEGED